MDLAIKLSGFNQHLEDMADVSSRHVKIFPLIIRNVCLSKLSQCVFIQTNHIFLLQLHSSWTVELDALLASTSGTVGSSAAPTVSSALTKLQQLKPYFYAGDFAK